jgi:Sec-independent protein translocase protein TatA
LTMHPSLPELLVMLAIIVIVFGVFRLKKQ